MITTFEIFWDDLTDEAKDRLKLLYHDNINNSPIAIVDIEDLDDDEHQTDEFEDFFNLGI